MPTDTPVRSSRNLKTKEYFPGMVKASRKTRWLVSSTSPKSVDELTFTSRDELGPINWWDVAIPKTNYWDVHHTLGRAYAFELFDLLHNPEATDDEIQRARCPVAGNFKSYAPALPPMCPTFWPDW